MEKDINIDGLLVQMREIQTVRAYSDAHLRRLIGVEWITFKRLVTNPQAARAPMKKLLVRFINEEMKAKSMARIMLSSHLDVKPEKLDVLKMTVVEYKEAREKADKIVEILRSGGTKHDRDIIFYISQLIKI